MSRSCTLGLLGLALLSVCCVRAIDYTSDEGTPHTPFSDAASAVKDRPIGAGFTWSLGGSLMERVQRHDNRRDLDDEQKDDSFEVLHRLRLNTEFNYGHLFKAYIETQDSRLLYESRPFGPQNRIRNQNPFDLYQAYVEFGLLDDVADKPSLSIKLGRQEMTLGHQRTFGNLDWFNSGQSFDMGRTTWRPDGFDIDFFAGRPVLQKRDGMDETSSHVNFGGFHLKALGIPGGHTIQAYGVAKWDTLNQWPSEKDSFAGGSGYVPPSVAGPGNIIGLTSVGVGTPGSVDLPFTPFWAGLPGWVGPGSYILIFDGSGAVIGTAPAGNPTLHGERRITIGGIADGKFWNKRFDYSLESSLQFGDFGGDSVFAYRFNGELGYKIPMGWRYVRLAAGYSMASGDSDPTDGRHNSFDPFFPDTFGMHGKYQFVNDRNIQDWTGKVQARAWKGGMIEVEYHGLKLDQKRDGLYAPPAGYYSYTAAGPFGLRSGAGNWGKDVGQELDVQVTHVFNNNFSVSGGAFFFKPGSYFRKTGYYGDDLAKNFFLMARLSF